MKASLKYLVLVLITAFAAGCGKDDDAQPTTGTVKGSIAPANGASKVYLVAGTDTISGTPAASGTYELTQVKPGNYQLSVKPASGYAAPAATAVTVTAGKTTDVPAVTLTALPANGLMSVTMDGKAYSASPMFSPFGTGMVSIYPGTYQFHMTLPVITGPGTYTEANSDLKFRVITQATGSGWETDLTGGTATLTVTSYDPATKKGSATFSFSAPANGMGSTGTKVGTNGSILNFRLKM